jgi:hypothetical protein
MGTRALPIVIVEDERERKNNTPAGLREVSYGAAFVNRWQWRTRIAEEIKGRA